MLNRGAVAQSPSPDWRTLAAALTSICLWSCAIAADRRRPVLAVFRLCANLLVCSINHVFPPSKSSAVRQAANSKRGPTPTRKSSRMTET
jgi:hypothetical protein